MIAPPLRVLHVLGAGARGGAETVARTLIRHQTGETIAPSVVCLQEGPLVREFQGLAPVVLLPAGRFRQIHRGARVLGRLRELVAAQQIDLVHCHGTRAHLYGGLAARWSGVPAVCHVHDVPARRWSTARALEELAFRIPPRAVVAVSRYVADALPSSWRRRARVVLNGVDVPAAAAAGESAWKTPLATEIRRRFGWSPACPLVVWCGRLQRWKGTHVFLEAAARVVRWRPEARFLVVGGTLFGLEPAYEITLRELHRRLGLGEALAFAGQQDDVAPFLAAADLVVHCAIRPEPFGLVIVEAMALGTPVIAAAAGGPLEIVDNGRTGVLVAPREAEALAEAVSELLADPDRRRRLGEAGRREALTRFSAARMAEATAALYRELVLPPPATGQESELPMPVQGSGETR